MREVEAWNNASEAEFEDAMKGTKKLVMKRLYDLYVTPFLSDPLLTQARASSIFTPQVARAVPPRPVTTDDLERDVVLAQRSALSGWSETAHLDVPAGEGMIGFLTFAHQGLHHVSLNTSCSYLIARSHACVGPPVHRVDGCSIRRMDPLQVAGLLQYLW